MAAADLYPFSSDKGTPIPLEIVRPRNLVSFSFAVNIEAGIILPPTFNICWLYATEACILRTNANNAALPAPLVSGSNYADAMYIPGKTPLIAQLTAGNGRILGLETAGILYINHIQQWAGMALNQQTSYG